MPKRRNNAAQRSVRTGPKGPLRLQRVLAQAGFGSRRECEQLISQGRVEVGGEVVTQMGTRADPAAQVILVDGVRVRPQTLQYFVLNKPAGVLSTNRDPAGRTRVIDLIPAGGRVYTVGRLDKSSEGLILVTNDGDLANWLTHPRYGVDKTYHVQVAGHPGRAELQQLRRGVHLAEGVARVQQIRVRRNQKHTADLEIVLNEGRNREIRRILARCGHKVLKLRRVAIGPIRLGNLPLGAHRRLEARELDALRRAMNRSERQPKTATRDPSQRQPSKPGSSGRGSRQKRTATERPASRRGQPPRKRRMRGRK